MWLTVAVHGLVGWTICGATVAVGRQFVSMGTTLLIHAVVAPVAFGLLAARCVRRFPRLPALDAAALMTLLVVSLDALVVAPFFEHSFMMFRSVIGTWVPFASIFVATSSVIAWRRTP